MANGSIGLKRPGRRGSELALALALTFAALVSIYGSRAYAADDKNRIVSIGGAVTEIIYALGQADRLVAIDTTSTFPEAAAQLPNVGYMRALSAEGVLSLQPDLIIASESAGPPQVVSILRNSSVPFVEVPDFHSLEGVLKKIDIVGEALNVSDTAETLKATFSEKMSKLASDAAGKDSAQKVAFFISLRSGNPIAAGSDTAADAMIRLAGAENVFAGFSGYKPVTAESLAASKPEAIITMGREGSDMVAEVLAIPGINLTPAGQSKRVFSMEGSYFLGFGPRTVAAVRELSGRLEGESAGESNGSNE